MTGIKPPDYVDGHSLVPQLRNPATPMPAPAICTWGRGNYTLRDAQWRYTRYFDGSEELYSHAKDADEWTNLADNPEYASVKKRLGVFIPKQEVPLVKEGASDWSIPASADKPKRK
jgi:hypothetical protein